MLILTSEGAGGELAIITEAYRGSGYHLTVSE